jgi:hypothetical protein
LPRLPSTNLFIPLTMTGFITAKVDAQGYEVSWCDIYVKFLIKAQVLRFREPKEERDCLSLGNKNRICIFDTWISL